MKFNHLRRASIGVLCFGVAAVLFFAVHLDGTNMLFSSDAARALLPYLFAFGAAALPQFRPCALCVLLGCGTVVSGGTFAYYQAFMAAPHSMSPLALFFVPIYQVVASVALLVFSCLASFIFLLSDVIRSPGDRLS